MASKVSRLRRWYHLRRGHSVVGTVVRDYTTSAGKHEFFWARGFVCVDCNLYWRR